MSLHVAEVRWRLREGDDFLKGHYSRAHELRFDGGTVMPGSASPSVVPAPWAEAAAVDPEESFVAALSACHMLWFLDLARRAGVLVRRYEDAAEGQMGRIEGRAAIVRVTLRPQVDSDADPASLEAIHHRAHEACFIANSVKSEVVIEPRATATPPGGR